MTVLSVGLLAIVAVAWPMAAGAQRYVMRDGTVLEAADVERRDNLLVEPLTDPADEGVAERLHALSDVVRVEWPEPEALAAAREQLEKGSPEGALAQVAPVVREFAAFAAVEGSWWDEATLLEARALLAAERSTEASPLIQALLAAQPAPEAEQMGRLLFVEIDLAEGRTELASAMLDRITNDETLPGELIARTWWLRGEVLLRQGEYEQALEAYLQVPAFHGRERALRPRILAGTARAYRKFGDAERADRALNRLLGEYPDHPLSRKARVRAEAPISSTFR